MTDSKLTQAGVAAGVLSVARARAERLAELAVRAGHPANQIEVTEREGGAIAEVVVHGQHETIQVIYRHSRGSRCRVFAQHIFFGRTAKRLRAGQVHSTIQSATPAETTNSDYRREPIEGVTGVCLVDGTGAVAATVVRISTGYAVQIFPGATKIGVAGEAETLNEACQRAEQAHVKALAEEARRTAGRLGRVLELVTTFRASFDASPGVAIFRAHGLEADLEEAVRRGLIVATPVGEEVAYDLPAVVEGGSLNSPGATWG